MLWTADSIHDFAKADRQKSPSEELIVSWPLHWMTFLKRWSSAVFRVFPNHEVLRYFFVTTSAVFFASFFFSFESTVPKQGCVLYTGAHYTWVNTVFFTPKFTAYPSFDGVKVSFIIHGMISFMPWVKIFCRWVIMVSHTVKIEIHPPWLWKKFMVFSGIHKPPFCVIGHIWRIPLQCQH